VPTTMKQKTTRSFKNTDLQRSVIKQTKHFTITALKRQTYHRWDKLGAGTVLMKIKSYGTTLFILHEVPTTMKQKTKKTTRSFKKKKTFRNNNHKPAKL
jgi:hypothetical protein